jgi:hypothetical protein
LTEGTAWDDSSSLEPCPWGSNLATVAAEWHALGAIAASSGVGDGEECLESTTGGNAFSVIQGLGCAVSPAWSAIWLVANEVDDW